MRLQDWMPIVVVTLLARVAVAGPNPDAPRIEVLPQAVHLHGADDSQGLVVRRIEASGLTRDVTADARFAVTPPEVARIAEGTATPLANGVAQVTVTVGDASATLSLEVAAVDEQASVSFRRDVMPVLTKAGCNMGSCHGSARGQDGFHLSLFGFDPAGDHFSLTRELPGRRLNLAMPERSLLLEKAAGRVPHTGGQRLEPDTARYETLVRWLRAGAPNDPPDLPPVEGIEVFPADNVVLAATTGERQGGDQQLVVRARFADGRDRDVTRLATFMTSTEPVAAVSDTGRITADERGEALIMARFDAHTVGVPVIVVPEDAPVPDLPAGDNVIDRLINAKLRRLRIEPSRICSDETFLRRAYLDIIGQLPTPEAYESFLADDAPDKRARLVDALLSRKEFAELWVMKWAERLQLRSTQEVSYKATLLYYEWLQQRIADGVPIDEIVRELLTASGGTFTNPATNYFQLERDTLKLAENTAQVFMGLRLQCAQCHNHPFDRWTMDDYYGFAAFFGQVGRKQGEDPRETIVFDNGSGEVRHAVDNRPMPPRFLGGEVADVKGRDRRGAFADWLTAPDNPFFARNLVNFVWDHFFGRGIVEPVDDVRVSNPPANPALLDALAERLVASDYDLQGLVRAICNSDAYQRSTQPTPTNAGDERNFARAQLRRLRAEILLDVISQVTGAPDKFKGLPLGARAVQIADGNVSNYFLTTFGRARRETACTCEVRVEPNLSQALHLVNGQTVHRKIHEGGRIGQLLEQGLSPAEVLERLYVACLSREPTESEREALLASLADASEPQQPLEDVFWALLNSKEFIFNH